MPCWSSIVYFSSNTHSNSMVTVSGQKLSAHHFGLSVCSQTFALSVYGDARLFFRGLHTYSMPIGSVSRSGPELWVVLFPPNLLAYLSTEAVRSLSPGGRMSNRAEQSCSDRRVSFCRHRHAPGHDSRGGLSWCSNLRTAARCCSQATSTFLDSQRAALSSLQQILSHGSRSLCDRFCQWESLVHCNGRQSSPGICSLRGSVNILSLNVRWCIYRAAVTAAPNIG